jgi:hypothetical protein
MPAIELSEKTFRDLQQLAEPLVDTPDSIVARLVASFQLQTKKNGGNGGPSKKRKGRITKTRNEEFYGPIVKVLREAGGELRTSEAVDRVGQLMCDRLTEADHATLKSGEVRWENTVRFARHDLVKQGKLAAHAPFGVWRLSNG